VPIAYTNSPHQPRHRHEILSTDAVSSLQTAWTHLTPSLDHQDLILAVNRRHGSHLARLPSAADGALLAQRTRGNILSATTAVESVQTLAAELSTSHKGFPKDPRRKHVWPSRGAPRTRDFQRIPDGNTSVLVSNVPPSVPVMLFVPFHWPLLFFPCQIPFVQQS